MSLSFSAPWNSVGKTPLIKITPRLYAKLETVNPTGSIKDRPIQYIVERAIHSGEIDEKSILVEATSGNTGISLSALGASLGLPVKIIMPQNMSEERQEIMKSFGAEVILVGDSDFDGAIELRNNLCNDDRFWSPQQFENVLNIQCHKEHIGTEIINDLADMNATFSAFVAGSGTGGTIMGVRSAIIEKGLGTHVCMVQPYEKDGTHGIQGIADGSNFLANPHLVDRVFRIKTRDAKIRAKLFAQQQGVLVGISSGANLCAAETYIQTFNPAGIVVTILCDRGERYLSDISNWK